MWYLYLVPWSQTNLLFCRNKEHKGMKSSYYQVGKYFGNTFWYTQISNYFCNLWFYCWCTYLTNSRTSLVQVHSHPYFLVSFIQVFGSSETNKPSGCTGRWNFFLIYLRGVKYCDLSCLSSTWMGFFSCPLDFPCCFSSWPLYNPQKNRRKMPAKANRNWGKTYHCFHLQSKCLGIIWIGPHIGHKITEWLWDC